MTVAELSGARSELSVAPNWPDKGLKSDADAGRFESFKAANLNLAI